jgi:hypothetical protein
MEFLAMAKDTDTHTRPIIPTEASKAGKQRAPRSPTFEIQVTAGSGQGWQHGELRGFGLRSYLCGVHCPELPAFFGVSPRP